MTEEKKTIDRQRHIIVLVVQHLVSKGYVSAAEALQREAGVSCGKFEVADNVDLTYILQEFEDYYEMRFSRKPKLVRRLGADTSSGTVGSKTKTKRKPVPPPTDTRASGSRKASAGRKGSEAKHGDDVDGDSRGKPMDRHPYAPWLWR